MLGITTYKLSAQLDNRTSRFCRFIHGKTFTLESAQRVLDLAVYADDPESLKAIHPWPDQSNASMDKIEAMTTEQLRENGYGVPPFHPGCRTLMVKVGYKSRIRKPPSRTSTLEPYASTAETFMELGIKTTPTTLHIWNDYMAVHPGQVLSLLENKPLTALLGASKKSIKFTPKGNIVLNYRGGRLTYIPGVGSMSLSSALSLELAQTGNLQALRSLGGAIGADELTLLVPFGEALRLGALGVVPTLGAWPSLRTKIRDAWNGMVSAGVFVPEASQRVIEDVLISNSPASYGKLFKLNLPPPVLEGLLSKVEFRGVHSFDTTGLS
jgi:hypothetical protein